VELLRGGRAIEGGGKRRKDLPVGTNGNLEPFSSPGFEEQIVGASNTRNTYQVTKTMLEMISQVVTHTPQKHTNPLHHLH